MRQVAAAGIRLDKEGCKGNALLLVTSGKKALIDLLRLRETHLLGDRSDKEIAALRNAPGPAVAWQVIEPRGADGRIMEKVTHVQLDPRRKDRVDAYVLPHVSVSRIGVKTRVEFLASVVAIEAPALLGASVTQVADYAAMRLFAATDTRAGSSSAPTILSLLDDRATGTEPPPSLTNWDLGYLRALYEIPSGFSAFQQQGRMANILARHLAQSEASGE